jgi:hypothetical protein
MGQIHQGGEGGPEILVEAQHNAAESSKRSADREKNF